MPEGDSVAGHARRLRPVLLGETITEIGGTSPSVRANSDRILDAKVVDVRTIGKHLILDLDTGFSIRVHLGMPGHWRISTEALEPRGSVRLYLRTASGSASCYSAPTVEVDRTPAVEAKLARLGPDLLADFDGDEFVRRARTNDSRTMADLLLDQRVLAGIGNVYKSELLFLEGIHPSTLVGQVSNSRLLGLARRAQKLMSANVGANSRTTTGSRQRGRDTWVYGRAGRPCLRCGHAIRVGSDGDRVTYWCPDCQPLGSPGE